MILAVILLQIIVFGVVIYALKRIMVGNTESAVNRLNQSYAEITNKKEELTKKIKQIEEECERQRQDTQKEIKKMREDTDNELKEKRDRMMDAARQKAEETINDALEAKEKIKEDIQKEEQMKMIAYCEQLIKATISNFMQQELNNLFVKEALEDLKEIDPKHIPPEIMKVDLILAQELNPELFSQMKNILAEKIKRKISFKQTINESLVAGIVLKFGSLVLDQSLATKLQNQSIALKAEVEES